MKGASRHQTWQEPIKQDPISGLLFRPSWDSSTPEVIRYTVLMSPKKDETAAHFCEPALSALVVLVSRIVFHVVSALHSHYFLSVHMSFG